MNDTGQLNFGFNIPKNDVETDSAKLFSSIFNKTNILSPIKRIPTEDEIKVMEVNQLNILKKHFIGKNTMVENMLANEFEKKAKINDTGKLSFSCINSINEFFTKKLVLKKYSRSFSFENETENSVDVVMLLPDNLANDLDIVDRFNSPFRQGNTFASKREIYLTTEMYCTECTVSDPVKKDTLIPDRNLVNVTVNFKRFGDRPLRDVDENSVGIDTVSDVVLYEIGKKILDEEEFEFFSYDGYELMLKYAVEKTADTNDYYRLSRDNRDILRRVVRDNEGLSNDKDHGYDIYSDLESDDTNVFIRIIKCRKIN